MFSKNILIKGRNIGKGQEPFLIAEVGINHQGKLKRALKMIEIAKCNIELCRNMLTTEAMITPINPIIKNEPMPLKSFLVV